MKRIYLFIRHHGLLEFIRRIKIILLKRIFIKRDVIIFKYGNNFNIEENILKRIKKLTIIDIKKMLAVMYLSEENIIKRFDNGDQCFAVMDKENIETYIWVQFKIHWMEELLLTFQLTNVQAWLYNVVTVKNARGKGYYKNILQYLGKCLSDEDITEIYGYAEKRNIPSISGLKKAGYIPVVEIYMSKLFLKTRYKVIIFNQNNWNQLIQTILNFNDEQWITENR